MDCKCARKLRWLGRPETGLAPEINNDQLALGDSDRQKRIWVMRDVADVEMGIGECLIDFGNGLHDAERHDLGLRTPVGPDVAVREEVIEFGIRCSQRNAVPLLVLFAQWNPFIFHAMFLGLDNKVLVDLFAVVGRNAVVSQEKFQLLLAHLSRFVSDLCRNSRVFSERLANVL